MPRVAIVVSTVGYHWEEVYRAYVEFVRAGFDILFFTVDGSPPQADPISLEKHSILNWVGYGISPAIAPDAAAGRDLWQKLSGVQPVARLEPDQVDILYIPGGHGCLFDVNRHPEVRRKVEAVYRQHKLLASVCHATSTLAFARDHDRPITQGKRLTGFPDLLDHILIRLRGVHTGFLPIPYSNDRALLESGARIGPWTRLWATLNPWFSRWDKPFATGLGPKAAGATARRVILEYSKAPRTAPTTGTRHEQGNRV